MKFVGQFLLCVSLQSLFLHSLSASVIFDDDFTGTTGTVPAGWTLAAISDAGGSVQDLASSIVRISDPAGSGPVVVSNNTGFNPSAGFTYTGTIDAISGDNAFFGIVNDLAGSGQPRLLVEIENGTDLFVAATHGGNTDFINLGSPVSLGNEIIFTVDDAVAGGRYRVQNDGFDSGFRSFSTDFTTSSLTLATFGAATEAAFGTSGNSGTATADFNRLTLSSTTAVPEPTSFALLGLSTLAFGLQHIVRRRKSRTCCDR